MTYSLICDSFLAIYKVFGRDMSDQRRLIGGFQG
jgi:hypothetical protein